MAWIWASSSQFLPSLDKYSVLFGHTAIAFSALLAHSYSFFARFAYSWKRRAGQCTGNRRGGVSAVIFTVNNPSGNAYVSAPWN